ncbi:MAG: phosphate signaling complex protein PhoU [Oscillospiraceae bacterium]
MRNKFDTQLLELNNNLTMMGALCENAISMAVKAFLNGEHNYADRAIEVDCEIDEKEKEIEQQCLRLLLQQQPVAKDLRIISSALKMITDIERIGDQASDIAELSKYTLVTDTQNYPHIKKMAEESVKMVTDSIDSFVKQDLELANYVIAYDDIVDDLFCKVKSDIIELIKTEHSNAEVIIDILMIAKYLERIADHSTNIAEWVVFSITGKHKEE